MQIAEVGMADSDPCLAEGPWSIVARCCSSDAARRLLLCSRDKIVHVMADAEKCVYGV